FDRLDDDFAALNAPGTPVVFDAGSNDTNNSAFTRAFDVIRRFNEEALAQNVAVEPDGFETQAARTWLRLHARSDEHFPPTARGFSTTAGPIWQASEANGLRLLNRYCFRCHGSVSFSVFDRPTVVGNAGLIIQHIDPNAQQQRIDGWKMPPDRQLPQQDLND